MGTIDSNKSNDIRASQYKAKIDSVSPTDSRSTFDRNEECFLGVSLENTMFERPKLDAIIEWISRRFKNCTVLIGDSIHRLTLQSVRGLSVDESTTLARTMGDTFVKDKSEAFKNFSDRTKFDFLPCGTVQQWPDYQSYYSKLQHAFQTDSDFSESVRGFSRHYHERRGRTFNRHDVDEQVELSCQYFLEEFAIFACLKQQGISVMVYPGSFSTLTEIAAGSYPKVPAQLRDLVVVALHLKSRRKS